jgi:PAS domain S-box-containing protein
LLTQLLLEKASHLGHLGAWAIELPGFEMVWSNEALTILGFAPGDEPTLELGRSLIEEPWRSAVADAIDAAIQHGTPWDLEYETRTFDGRRVWVRCIGEAEVSAQGRVARIVGALQDVTRARQMRETLADREERYRLLFETSVDGIFQTLPDGSIVAANPAACAMFRTTEEELCRRGRDGLVAPDDIRLRVMLEERERSGRAFGRLLYVRPDGSRFEAEATTATYRDSHGRTVSNVIMRDITRRLAYEREILSLNEQLGERVRQRTAELEAANGELRAFAHSLAHDLRSPVAAIEGFAAALEDSLAAAGLETDLHYVNRIRAGATRMHGFIDALLTLASVSQQPLDVGTVNLSSMAASILSELQDRDPGRQVSLHVQPGVIATGDARLLRMALENLLGNAWKFTSKRCGAQIWFGCDQGSGAEKVLWVKDNGSGFDMVYAEKLFTAFQRLHTETEFPGTGIGLANVSRIIARHGGRVWAEGAEDEGATFYFTLGSPSAV